MAMKVWLVPKIGGGILNSKAESEYHKIPKDGYVLSATTLTLDWVIVIEELKNVTGDDPDVTWRLIRPENANKDEKGDDGR